MRGRVDYKYDKVKRWSVYAGPSGGTRLEVPKTPVESLMLRAKLHRLKREFLRRNEAGA